MVSIRLPRREVGRTYDNVVRAAEDSGEGREAMARWVLVVPWYTECYPDVVGHDLLTMGATADESNSDERTWW